MQLFDESKAITQQGLVCEGLNRQGPCPDPRLYLVQNLASVFNPATGTFERERGTLQITCPHSRPLVDSDDESEEERAVRAQLAIIRKQIQQTKASMAADISDDDEEEDVAMHKQPLPVKQESSCCSIC